MKLLKYEIIGVAGFSDYDLFRFSDKMAMTYKRVYPKITEIVEVVIVIGHIFVKTFAIIMLNLVTNLLTICCSFVVENSLQGSCFQEKCMCATGFLVSKMALRRSKTNLVLDDILQNYLYN